MTTVGVLGAFLGGLLTLVSPCSVLLLPSFFAYSFGTRTRLVLYTFVFYLGLVTTLVPLGVAGSFAGRLFYGHRELLVTVGGWTVIVLGAAQLLGLGFGLGAARRAAGRLRPVSVIPVYLLGAVYGLAGFCAGPILGAVLTVSAVGGRPVMGGTLLAVYALGMAVPLFLLALVWERFSLGSRAWLKGRGFHVGRLRLHTTSVVSGLVFIGIGVVFLLFDGASALPPLLGVGTEFRIEQRLRALAAPVTDRTVGLVLTALVLIAVAVRLLRPRRRR